MNNAGKIFAIAVALGSALLAVARISIPAAQAGELVAPWVEGFNNKVRLIAGTSGGGPAGATPQTYAGVEISMPSGWKTYWRNPGEAGGVPPEFDFSGSENLAKAEVLYPAPHRLIDPKAGQNIGYKDHVTFPIAIHAKDASKPVSIKVKATYGVCKDICVPAEAELSLDVPSDAPASADLTAVLSSVPAGTSGTRDLSRDPELKKWRIEGVADKPKLVLEVTDPGGEDGDVFLFSPDGLYMPMTRKVSGGTFEADLTEGAKPEELKGKTISATLTGSKGQSETMIQLP